MTLKFSRMLPLAALTLFAVITFTHALGARPMSWTDVGIALVLVPVLFGTVFASVEHAEAVAHRIGEPAGTLLLTLAVTVIEVALIATLMLQPAPNPTLARDTVFSIIMIVCNGLVGLCILLGGLKYREQGFVVAGASAYLAVIITLGTITLLLPNYTQTVPGPYYSAMQLAMVSLMTAALYGVFLYIQTVRHQAYFADGSGDGGGHAGGQDATAGETAGRHATPGEIWPRLFWLAVSLLAVILLAKKFAVVVEATLGRLGAPDGITGIIVALLILAPEGAAAIRAARQDRLQRSLNLALGSTLATIGLTIPAVALVNLVLQKELTLGLGPRDSVLLMLTFIISLVTFGTGRSNILLGLVHLVIFATYILFAFIP